MPAVPDPAAGLFSEATPAETATGVVARLLAGCVDLQASDLHVVAGDWPHARIAGELRPLTTWGRPSAGQTAELARELARQAGRGELPELGAVDGAVGEPPQPRFRFNVYRRRQAWGIALRRLEDRISNLASLGLRTDLYDLGSLTQGLVVVAGPTGAGKSTTLAALIDHINQTRRCHIVTIEDPIEYLHPPALSLVTQRQVGSDVAGFGTALVEALRQDPDVILVGEMRDRETMRTALTAAETGHLVFSTVHAGSCTQAIERLVAVFPAEEQPSIRRQLSLVLRCLIAQSLVRADGPKGGRGRRVPLCEILMLTPGVAHLVASGKSAQLESAIQTGASEGMQTYANDLARLVREGLVSEMSARHLLRSDLPN